MHKTASEAVALATDLVKELKAGPHKYMIAPSFTGEALVQLQAKANVRVLQIALPPGGTTPWDNGLNLLDVKRVGSGLLMQTADNHRLSLSDMQVVTTKQPSPAQMQDLLFAWKVA